MGIIINRPIKLGLNDILAQLNLSQMTQSVPVFWGGPVQEERGFIIHSADDKETDCWESSMEITKDIHLTTSKDIIKSIAEERGPADYIICLGYAGWGAGQLEQELAENTWLCSPASSDILFNQDTASKRSSAINSLGITEHQLNAQIGHA